MRMEAWRIPKGEAEQKTLTQQIGEDGRQLLQWVYADESPEAVRQNKAVEVLRRVWIQEYYQQGEDITWRGPDNLPPEEIRTSSPYDPEAR